MSQGGKDPSGKAAGKGGGKKGWSPLGFQGSCYNCGEQGHSAKWCPKGKGGTGGQVSWMSAWGQEWDTGAVAEGSEASTVPTFALWLRPKKTIKSWTRYKAIEPEEEEEFPLDRWMMPS